MGPLLGVLWGQKGTASGRGLLGWGERGIGFKEKTEPILGRGKDMCRGSGRGSSFQGKGNKKTPLGQERKKGEDENGGIPKKSIHWEVF